MVGDFYGTIVKDDIAKIINNYGKRIILENNVELKEQAYDLMINVVAGNYGEDTKKALPIYLMQEIFENATAKKDGKVINLIDFCFEQEKGTLVKDKKQPQK